MAEPGRKLTRMNYSVIKILYRDIEKDPGVWALYTLVKPGGGTNEHIQVGSNSY